MNVADEYIFRFVGKDEVTGTMRRIGTGARTTENSVMGVQKRINGMRTDLRGAASEIPMFSNAFRIASNPIAIAGAGVALITKELHESAVAANKFNSEFRELQNLNLDKTRAELNSLKFDVLKTAGDNAFNPYKTSTAFYDVQSITGMYGSDVAELVGKQGEFAKVMNADFNEYITGTGKAMANFGFGIDQLDAYNRSAYATVKVGSITFEQLAKNQAVYAGYAASANQSFESANKLMTLFTLKTKSSEESATLVKSAFTDLFKPEVIKSFQDAGVKMFDPLTNDARQVDDILLDLNRRFSTLEGHKAINDLRNEFKGSEGLISLIQLATDQTGNLQRSLSAMDNANANTPKAKSIFEKDVNELKKFNEQLRESNRIMRGQKLSGLPHFIQSYIKNIRESINAGLQTDLLLQESDPVQLGYNNAYSDASKFINSTYGEDKDLGRINKRIVELNSPFSLPSLAEHFSNQLPSYKMKGLGEFTSEFINSQGLSQDQLTVYGKDLTKFASEMYPGRVRGARAGELDALIALRDSLGNTSTTPEPKNDPLSTNETESKINAISGGGAQDKHITISIENVVDELIIQSQTLPEGLADMEEQVKQVLVRVLQGTEQVMA